MSIPANGRAAGSPWQLFEASVYLNISERHLARLIANKKIKTIRMGRRVLISDAEMRRIASKGTE